MPKLKTFLLMCLLLGACGDDAVSTIERKVASCGECTTGEICVEAHAWTLERLCVPAPATCTPGAGSCECVVGPCGANGYDSCVWQEEVMTCTCSAC